jgi:hypothetical protein
VEPVKPWWGSQQLPGAGTVIFIDDSIDNRDPDKLVSFLCWTIARAVFSTGPCMVQTKHGKDVHVLSSEIVATSTIPPEEWYTTPRGDAQAEWLRRLRDFAILYEVKPGDVGPDGVCTTQGVPYRDLEEARMAAREARRAAAAAAMDAALDSDSSDS